MVTGCAVHTRLLKMLPLFSADCTQMESTTGPPAGGGGGGGDDDDGK